MTPPVLEAFGNVKEKTCLGQTLVRVHFLKYKVDWLGFAVQKATCILTYKEDRLEECLFPGLYLPHFSILYHPCPPPLVLLLAVEVPFSSLHWL